MVAPLTPGWQPTTIRYHIKSLDTGSSAVVVETDAGRAYLRGLGNRSGPHALARDWVGTQLAAWFGLRTLEMRLLEVGSEDELPLFHGGKVQSGPAIVTRAEEGESHSWSGSADDLQRLANPGDLARLVIFDTWIRNHDRQPPEGIAWKANPDNVFLSREGAPRGGWVLKAIDHSHCFDLAADLTPRLARIDSVQDERLYGLFPGFIPYLRPTAGTATDQQTAARAALARLAEATAAIITPMVATVPREWEVDTATRKALVELLEQRAAFLHGRLFGSLFPQPDLPLA